MSRIPGMLVGIALLLLAPPGAVAQQPPGPLSAMETAVACAPPPVTVDASPSALHVIGAQDTVPRRLFGLRDRLIIDGGTVAGVRVGQQYFVRRRVSFGASRISAGALHSVHTAGWVRIVAANETTAVGVVEHTCGVLLAGDRVEPFVAPSVPAGADRVDTTGELDFTSSGRVLYGDDERRAGAIGDFMLIDRGTEQGVSSGARFAIYRDLSTPGLPLVSIGEAVVVTTSPTLAVVRISTARDAVLAGDVLVPRKK